MMSPSKSRFVRSVARWTRWSAVLAGATLSSGVFLSSAGCGDRVRAPAEGASGAQGEAGAPSIAICGTTDPTSLAACVEDARYAGDLSFVAGDRTPGSAHWRAVQSLCAGRLTELGYEVELHEYGSGVNVIGVRTGTERPEELVFVSAHYDSVKNCPAADDNASGVAGVLEAARVLALRPHARTLAIACWDEEERRSDDASANGSAAYALRASARGDTIVGAFVLEMIGYASSAADTQRLPDGLDALFAAQVQQIRANDQRGDFLAVVADAASRPSVEHLAAEARVVDLPLVVFEIPNALLDTPAVAELRRSDHGSFWAAGYSGMMLTDTAEYRNPNYHCEGGQDVVDTLDLDFALSVVRTTTGAVARTLGDP